MRSDPSRTRFLNVDLEIVARGDISAVIEALGSAVFVLRDSAEDGLRTVWLELAGGNPADAEDAVRQFVALVDALPPAGRSAWLACDDRCLNIGIEASALPHAVAFPLSAAAVAGIGEIGARLVVTVYTPQS